MRAVLQTIRILVLIVIVHNTHCQDGFNNQDILRVQQVGNDGHIETITGYSKNDPNSQSMSSLNVQYQMQNNANNYDFNRDRGRTRKVYRIKNPFQGSQGDETQMDSNNSQDTGTAASNQYAGMQYSLPPEEFLQQMRAENQYLQQQQQQQQQHQQQQQLSTQASVYSYTATPQPQYSYSTMTASNYDNQPLQNMQEQKSLNSMYNSNQNTYQYNTANSYNLDTPHSTPAPSFLSTPSNQYNIGTPTNTFVSSASPMYITSPPNLQPYVSSPYTNTQTGTVDYNSNRVSTIGNSLQNYDTNMLNKKIQMEYGNNLRYQTNSQNQYQNDYPSSTISPVSSPYSEEIRDNWQSSGSNYNNGLALPKSSQDLSLSQYPLNTHYRYNNQEDTKIDNNYDNINQDSRRFGALSAANNVYYNYINPDNQQQNNYKVQVREVDQQFGQTPSYSHGDYGWKLNERRSPSYGGDVSTGSYSGYQLYNTKSDNSGAMSQVNFHMDTSRPYNYNQISKSSTEKLEAEEFARAAAKAHENLKQQLEADRLSANHQYGNNVYSNGDTYYTNNDKSRNKYENQNSNQYSSGSMQTDYNSPSQYFSRENYVDKPKQSFDHDSAIKNIVPIDVSNVVQNSNAQMKSNGLDLNNKYSLTSYNKEQVEQNLKQANRPTSETYYKDKNNVYSFGIKSQPEEYMSIAERLKQKDSVSLQGKSQSSDAIFGFGGFSGNKRYVDDSSQLNNYGSHSSSNQDSSLSADSIQQNILQRKPLTGSDIATLMKFNDIPLRLTHNLNVDSFRLQNNNFEQNPLPNPLPVRLSQNLENHHVDVATDILNKLIASKQNNINNNRQETESQNSNLLSTINGFKVANPFNIDLKLVAEMLKGKPIIDDSQLSSLRDQYAKPIKFDIPQIQQLLLKNDNTGLSSSIGTIPSSYFDIFSNNHYPFQGIKYSRSEEGPENIPIAEPSNSHPIGAVVEEDTSLVGQDNTDLTETDEDTETNIDEDRPLKMFSTNGRTMGDRYRHTSSLTHGRHAYLRKYPKSSVDQPYPLLKPPPPHKLRSKVIHHSDKSSRKRRVNKPKSLRFFKTEALYEANASDVGETKTAVSTLLKPPPVMEDKSDMVDEEENPIEET
ncbi:putative uncharacterized protein DDB_G0282129 [Colias croceus]|uniref:putative uncharacterized protein DDB_G0282129 n=1 Tax=Colias crocea TaxID=72248 RepID=UPI001E27D608|nr:putative uncharacterized protein DDB_G0282129 [Colias croceus]